MTAYDPDRIKFPMVRAGARGEGKYRRASWDEALDLTAAAMLDIKQKYGPEAMIFSSTHNLSQPLFENLLYAFGSPNYGTQRSLCFNAMIVANLMTYGMEEPARDYSHLKYIILTGRNLTEAISTSETGELIEALNRGVKVIYLDPRFTKTAAKATEWLPIKPGTDLAFHLAMLNVIVTENLYNADFVAKNTIGFEELQQSIGTYRPNGPRRSPRSRRRRSVVSRENSRPPARMLWRTTVGARPTSSIHSRPSEPLPSSTRWSAIGARPCSMPAARAAAFRWAHPNSHPIRVVWRSVWMVCRGNIRWCR